jgi:Flp pilus assembly protein TadG
MKYLMSRRGSAADLINTLAWPNRLWTMRQMQPEFSARNPRGIRGASDGDAAGHGFRLTRAVRGWLADRRRRRPPARCRRSRSRATAALEFALATPLLVVILGGAADYGLAQFYRTSLANAVAAGCEYAYLTGTGVTAANIQTVVTNTMFLPAGGAANLTVTVTGPKGYCVTGSGPTMSAATVPSTCSDGSAAGTYVLVTATYTNTGLMHGFMGAASEAMTEAATARLN